MPHDTVLETGRDDADDDALLMQRISIGDQAALQSLMRRHLGRTVRLAARVAGDFVAEDIAQEVFLRIWQHAERWKDPEQAGAKFTTWLYRITVNMAIDQKRKQKFIFADESLMPFVADPAPGADVDLQQKQQMHSLRSGLSALPERQRAAFALCFYEEKSNQEAADILGVSLKSLESLLVRARRSLRQSVKRGLYDA